MEDGLLSLKWNNHKTTFFDILRVLREKANYTDATIAVEGKFYPVHKLVMSTCSEYFSEIFERTPCKSPVVVLKDVRSQDMDALLDYMYLGEVNVNQNDLASLLKTAECLRIKGLAVPDEDPTKARKNLPDDRRESPPPKRRRHEDSTSSSTSAHQSTRPVSPSAPSPSKATAGGQAQAPAVQQHSSSGPPNSKSQDLDTSVEPPPMVKVEMEETDDPDDGYRRDNSFDGGKANDGDAGDFGSEVSKSEHDPETYGGGGSYAGPSLQQGGDLPWDEGDSSSFPPEGFSGDLPAGQQPQGGVGGYGGVTLGLVAHAMSRLYMNHPSPADTHAVNTFLPEPPPRHLLPFDQIPHDDLRPDHNCRYCGKHCETPSQLAIHLRAHTGERPYSCPHCDYRATQKHHVKSHLQRRHKEQTAQHSDTHGSPPTPQV